ncbi:MAG: HAMP domain-containing protein, partial [bacterium]
MSGWMMKHANKNQPAYFRKRWRSLKIRHKLALISLPIPLFAVVLIGASWYRNALHAVNKTLEEQTSVLAQNASLRVDDFFHERELEIIAVARLSWLENLFRESLAPESGKQLEKYAENFKTLLAHLDGGYFQITCFDFRQQPLAKVQLTSFFSQNDLPAHFETFYFEAQDKIWMNELAALPANEIHISEVKSIRGVKALVLGIAMFEAQSARRIGAMTFNLPISRVAEKTIMSYSLGVESRVMLVDKNGDLIYHPDRKKLNQNIRAALPYLGHVIDPILRLKKGTAGYHDENHEAWIISYTPVKTVQWITGVASPVAPFIQSTERAGLMGIAITLSVAGLLLFLINRLSRRLVRDLSEVTEGAKAIAAGDLNRQLPVRSGDEIGELAADFNIMAADLKQLMRERQANETLIAVGKFSAALAHDLRNPVEGLRLLSRELGKRVDPQ